MAGAGQRFLDGAGAQPFDQQVGGHVVTGGDHLLGGCANRNTCPHRQFQAGRAHGFAFGGDRQQIIPGHRVVLDRTGQRM